MDIYNEKFVEHLFNRMSKTYGAANYISSFGFTERWRRQCIREIDWGAKIEKGFDYLPESFDSTYRQNIYGQFDGLQDVRGVLREIQRLRKFQTLPGERRPTR